MTRSPLAVPVATLLDRVTCVRWPGDLDAPTRDAALRAVTDAFGVAAGGVVAPGVPASLEAYARAAGPGSVTVPWWGASLPAADAAMAFSLLVHAWDFDDTHDAAVVHACSVALPAALAVARATRATGAELLAGFVAGVEVICRLSIAVGVQRGVIRTAGLGSVGAAAAAARTMGLDRDGLERAVSLAAATAMAPTSRQVVEDGAISKRHQPGFAVRHGVTAAYLAAGGVAGPPGWFTGTHGLGALVADPERAAAGLTAPGWEVTRLSLKPIPACRYTHAAVDAVLSSMAGDMPEDVTAVRVHVPTGSTHELVARPWARRGQPIVDAQFSIPWLVAAALECGRLDLTTLTGEALLDPRIEERARTVEVRLDQSPAVTVMTPVRVVLSLADGTQRAVDVDDVPGSPERPLTWDRVLDKAAACLSAGGWEPGAAALLHHVVTTLEDRDADEALGRLGPPTDQPTSARTSTPRHKELT